jgi:hypothetical protein
MAITTVTVTMMSVRFLVSSRVGQVTLRSSARVSVKYLTIALLSLPVAAAALDFDFAILTHLPGKR